MPLFAGNRQTNIAGLFDAYTDCFNGILCFCVCFRMKNCHGDSDSSHFSLCFVYTEHECRLVQKAANEKNFVLNLHALVVEVVAAKNSFIGNIQ